MEANDLSLDLKLLERRMAIFEEKYGMMSNDFYAALMRGELADFDAYDEIRSDFSRWKGIYETWKRRKEAFNAQQTLQNSSEI